MKTTELKLSRIGNSRGVRIPADTLKRYGMDASVLMDELADGILLRSGPIAGARLTWEETALEMATSEENWSEWDAVAYDGLETIPWESGHGHSTTAEPKASYNSKERQRKARNYKRYDLCWATLDPVKGAEMAKTRPVVIVSLDVLNARLQTVTVCPLTTQRHPRWRTRLQVRCDGTPCEIAVDQIRTISKSRLGDRIDALSDAEATALRRQITELYGE